MSLLAKPCSIAHTMLFSDLALSKRLERAEAVACAEYAEARRRLFPDSGVYNVPLAFEAVGALDTAAFARALVALEERHHALRLLMAESANGRPRQRLVPAGGSR